MAPSLASTLANRPLRQIMWILPISWALHEAEEYRILEWYRTYWNNVGSLTELQVHVWLVFLSLVGFAWTGFALIPRSACATGHILLLFFIPLSFCNALQHVYWVFYFGAYSPGVVSSVLLLLPSTLYITVRAYREHLVSAWFLVLVYLSVVPTADFTLRLGNNLPDGGLHFYRLSAALIELLHLSG